MSDNNVQNIDPSALLIDCESWIILLLEEKLSACDNWMKLIKTCSNFNKMFFSTEDISDIRKDKHPSRRLLQEFIKRNVSVECLYDILFKSELVHILERIKPPEKLQLFGQSVSGVVYINDGDPAKVCISASGFPLPKFVWYKDDDVLIGERSDCLLIDKFRKKDEGCYACLIYQDLSDIEKIIWSEDIFFCLNKTKPFITKHPDSCELTEGYQLCLSCESYGYPRPTYTWMKDGLVLVSAQDNEFKVCNVDVTYSGKYKCIVQNSVGIAESDETVVKVDDRTFIQGQDVNLWCQVECSIAVKFTWVVDGVPLSDSSSINHTVIKKWDNSIHDSFLKYHISDTGGTSLRFLCIASSAFGESISHETTLRFQPCSITVNEKYIAGNKWALLIANNVYTSSPLTTPYSDAEKLAGRLTKIGFHCLVLSDLELVQFRNAVIYVSTFVQKGDYVVFYYGGHGFHLNGDNIMPVDAQWSEDKADPRECISPVWIRNCFQKRNPALIFVVLDMCRDLVDPVASYCGTSSEKEYAIPNRNSVILYGTAENYASLEDPESASVLAKYLIKHICENIPLQSLTQKVLQELKQEVSFIRKQQFPIVQIDMADCRSLSDISFAVNKRHSSYWNNMLSIGGKISKKVTFNNIKIDLYIYCTFGGKNACIHNELKVICEVGLLPDHTDLQCKWNYQEPLLLTVFFSDLQRKGVEEKICCNLGWPSISKAKFWQNLFCEERKKKITFDPNIEK